MKRPRNLIISAIVMCAILYAIGAFATAYISSPWGRGQFRPAVIIPAAFAVVFGPIPAALGASIGTLLADSIKHGTLYIPSLTAAVPGNFLGFYIFGRILEEGFSWRRFILASFIGMVIGNLVVAYLYVPTISLLGALPNLTQSDMILLATGLFLWFFVTEFPFMLILLPPLIRAISSSFPGLVPKEVRLSSLREDLPRRSFAISLMIPGLMMLAIWALMSFTIVGGMIGDGLAIKLSSRFSQLTLDLMKLMFGLSGGTLTVAGLILRAFYSRE